MLTTVPLDYNIVIDPVNKTVTEYKGCVCYDPRRKKFRVLFKNCQWNKELGPRYPSVGTLAEAITLQRTLSDQLSLTKSRSASYVDLNLTISEDIQKYIAGFFDGDGSIGSYKSNVNVSVSFFQSSNKGAPAVLKYIQEFYGGLMHHQERTDRSNHRLEYKLSFLGNYARSIANDLIPHVIVKKPQIQLAIQFINQHLQAAAANHKRLTEQDLVERVRIQAQIKLLKQQYEIIEIPNAQLAVSYLAGLFDAEGSVMIVGLCQLRAQITQFNCPRLLEALNVKFGRSKGKIYENGQLRFENEDGVHILQQVLPYSIVKKAQIEKALQFYSIKTRTGHKRNRTFEEQLEMETLQQAIKVLKRE